ncbi:hypothetical protein P389DRAFT_71088 [Cystobasidium minutum MCA 4210]|uniref:uncharacterized protein n=1 Tax=Cystobasidium minutum MCA 4210 TaxID=1397322 RepID=UPI0034CD2CE4|eukprot:jgi/Rhomi1/71088/CE71087_3137
MSVDTVPAPAPTDSAAAAPAQAATGSTSPVSGDASKSNTNNNGATSPNAGGRGAGFGSSSGGEGQFTLRALVTSKEAGIIIGKGGKNVADLREATGVKAGVSKVVQGVPERVLAVTGTLESVTKAYSAILANIAENPSAQNSNVAGGISAPIHLRILVANPVMGSIIGKAGATIQGLQAKHNAKIVTVKEMLPGSTERIVSVEGDLESVDSTLQELAKIISEQDPSRLTNHILYQPGSSPANAPLGMMGGVIGGTSPAMGGLPMGGYGGGMQQGGFQQQRGPYGNNNRGGHRNASGNYRNNPNNHHNNNQNAENGVVRDNNTGAAASQAVPTPSNPELRTQNISIPSDMVGCIIGRGGSKINEIRQQSGAKISIAKDAHDESGERMFTITGSSEALEKALFLLYGQLEGEKEKRIQNQKQEMEVENA